MLDFLALAQQCAPTVAPQTMAALVHVESRFNPYAIGVVGGRLERQPTTPEEAVSTAKALADGGWNFSMGMAQVNRYNLSPYKLDYQSAFDPCANLRAGSQILEECYTRAKRSISDDQTALGAALSCYYSGNFTRGHKPDKTGDPSYVQKVVAQANVTPPPIPVVPTIKGSEANPPQYDKAAPTTAAPSAAVSVVPATTAQAAPPTKPVTAEMLKVMPPSDDGSILVNRQQRSQGQHAQSAQDEVSADRNAPVRLRASDSGADSAPDQQSTGQRRARSQTPVF